MSRNIKRLLWSNKVYSAPVLLFSLAILFWTMFDNIIQYITPLILEDKGYTNTSIGLIMGFSSVAGALFDFFICKIFKSINFRRVLLIMFAICFIYPVLLWQADGLWFFLFLMAIWGFYYDLYGFGAFDFVGKYVKKANHSIGFGEIQVFRAIGDVLAPLIIGVIVVSTVDWQIFAISWIFLFIGFFIFLSLLFVMRKNHPLLADKKEIPRRKNLLIEVHLWEKLGKTMLPVLLLTFYLVFIDAFFWTLAPLYADDMGLGQFGGLFLMAFGLPSLIVGWFVGLLVKRFGKKRFAYFNLLIGSLIITLFFVAQGTITLIAIVFFASLFISMSLPTINSSYADYVYESPQVEGEIEGLEDFMTNIGYVIGPIVAGILADIFGMSFAFGIVGVLGVILAICLLIFSPKHIVIKTKPSEL